MTKLKDSKKLETELIELSLPRGRKPGTAGHRDAEEWISEKMENAGLQPYSGNSFRMPFSVGGENFVNFAGVIKGRFHSKPPLLIGAHYDSVIESYCADDNAAAVVIALAAGEYFASNYKRELCRDIIIAIFDSEEPPYFLSEKMGSRYFFYNQMDKRKVHTALIMDLVGHSVPAGGIMKVAESSSAVSSAESSSEFSKAEERIENLLFVTGAESSGVFPDIFNDFPESQQLNIVNVNTSILEKDLSDYSVFRTNDYPFLFLTCGRWEHYHKETDTPDKLNYEKMQYILKYLVDLILRIMPADHNKEAGDTLDLEISSFKNAFSFMLEPLLNTFKLKNLKDRKQLETVLEGLKRTGLV